MQQLSELITDEIKKISPGLRKELEGEFYKRIGFLPGKAFYSDNRLLRVFMNEADKFFTLTGHKKEDLENFCSANFYINDEHRKTIYKIATLSLVQLALWV